MMSGGTGKNELSAKDTQPKTQAAWGLPAVSTHQSYRWRSMGGSLAGAVGAVYRRRVRTHLGRASRSAVAKPGPARQRLPPLPRPTPFQHDDLTTGKIFRHLFRHLLGDAEEPLAAVHFLPDVLRLDAGGDPEHDEIIDQVGALFDDGFAIAVHGVDHNLDGLFGELLGHLAAARTQQPRRPRGRRIVLPAGVHRLIET